MEQTKHLLSSKYVEFSEKIRKLFIEREAVEVMRQRLRADNFIDHNLLVSRLYQIDNEALAAQQEYEVWKKKRSYTDS